MLQTTVNGTLDGLTRKVKKGIEFITFKITVPTPKEWERLKDLVDQDVKVSIAARQGSLGLVPAKAKAKAKATPKSAPADGASPS